MDKSTRLPFTFTYTRGCLACARGFRKPEVAGRTQPDDLPCLPADLGQLRPEHLGLPSVRELKATLLEEMRARDTGSGTGSPSGSLGRDEVKEAFKEALQREYPHCFNEAGQWRLPEA